MSTPLHAISSFPDDALFEGDVTHVDGAVALTSVPVQTLQEQGFRLGEPLLVHQGGEAKVGCYLGTLLPGAIDQLFGPDNLEDAEVAVAMAFDNRQRLTNVELISLTGAPVEPIPFAVSRGEIEVPIDGLSLAETPAAVVGEESVEVTVAAVGIAALAVRCDHAALEQIGVSALHRLTFQVDGRLRRVLQDRPENQANLQDGWEKVISRLPGGARLLRERARTAEALADASANGRDIAALVEEQAAIDAKIENITVPPVRAGEIPLVARLGEHWDDPSELVLVLRPMVGSLLSFVVESGQTIRLRRG